MFNLIRFNPLQEMERILDDSLDRLPALQSFVTEGFGYPVSIYDTKEDFIIRAAIPGINKENLEILTTKDTLVISGEIKAAAIPEGASTVMDELAAGKFRRAFKLPVPIQPDKVTATSIDGIFEIKLPKAENDKPFQIKID